MSLIEKHQVNYENLFNSNSEFNKLFEERFRNFLKNGHYVLGSEVEKFEISFAEYCKSSNCIGVANGLDALEIGLVNLDLPKNSEIIVPSNTYIATILAIINAGHIPVLVEPQISTYNLDPLLIEEKITRKTKAILVVHLYGLLADMSAIKIIATKYNLKIIEDCAQAHGAIRNGNIAGSFGDIGAYSFYPTKNLGALGDAGAIVCNDHSLAEKIRAYRNYGSNKKYYNNYLGRNSRLDELQAIFLNIKLPFLEKIINHKLSLAKYYNFNLTDKVNKPVFVEDGSHVYHIYNIRIQNRDELKSYLLTKNILTEIHYPVAPSNQIAYRQLFEKCKYPISELIHATTLSLPISYSTTIEDAKLVVKAVNDYFE